MSEKPKRNTDQKKDSENSFTEKEIFDENSRKRERQEKSYYYDDAHGYEIYQPDEEDEED